MGRTRILALDHFFDQDLRALAAHPLLDVRRFPYQRLRNPAMRIMTEAVSDGLPGYNRPELERRRRRYAAWLEREVRKLYLERAFDILVLPSDTFFYVRSLPAAVHALGIPLVVVQKETTISADTMEAHSRLTRDEAPFCADFMTVCSERQREFWLRAGADPALIEVTGQPRFDVYAEGRPHPSSPRRRVLFLSYDLEAYVPAEFRHPGAQTWERLRSATEAVLLDSVRSGATEVIVKCHPQQNHRAEEAHLATSAGALWRRGISLAPPQADTRQLILGADVVVGFQTTALYESVAAARPTIVAAWGEPYRRLRSGLIPFHEAPAECVLHATAPEQLAALLTASLLPPTGCARWYEQALGPVNGHATQRVAARLAAVASAWPVTSERGALDARRRHYAVGLLVRSVAAEAVWRAAIPIAHVAGQQDRVGMRRKRAQQGRAMAMTSLRGGDASPD